MHLSLLVSKIENCGTERKRELWFSMYFVHIFLYFSRFILVFCCCFCWWLVHHCWDKELILMSILCVLCICSLSSVVRVWSMKVPSNFSAITHSTLYNILHPRYFLSYSFLHSTLFTRFLIHMESESQSKSKSFPLLQNQS